MSETLGALFSAVEKIQGRLREIDNLLILWTAAGCIVLWSCPDALWGWASTWCYWTWTALAAACIGFRIQVARKAAKVATREPPRVLDTPPGPAPMGNLR